MKTKIAYLLFFSFITTFLTSCQKEQDINALYNTWEFEYFTKKGIIIKNCKEYPPENLNKMEIVFFENENLLVDEQNNDCGSTFKADKNCNLEISLLGCTKLGGTSEQLEWENRYFNAITSSKEFKIKDKKLKIYYDNDDETDVMVLKK